MDHEYPGLEVLATQVRDKLQDGVVPSDVGVTVFLTHYGEGGGLGYVSTVQREDMLIVICEWLDASMLQADGALVRKLRDRLTALLDHLESQPKRDPDPQDWSCTAKPEMDHGATCGAPNPASSTQCWRCGTRGHYGA